MGGFFSKIFDSISAMKTEESRLLMLGLDGAGKTTVLFKLKLGEVVTTIPTIGFNVESVTYKNLELKVWDIGGQKKIRVLWHHYYRGSNALIYVVDSNDVDRIDEAREELHDVLGAEELSGVPVLIFANKQDLPRALSTAKVAERLDVAKLRGHEWHVQGCNAISGDGLFEGLDWLAGTMKRSRAIEQLKFARQKALEAKRRKSEPKQQQPAAEIAKHIISSMLSPPPMSAVDVAVWGSGVVFPSKEEYRKRL